MLPETTVLTLSGRRRGDGQTHSFESEASYSIMPKLGDF